MTSQQNLEEVYGDLNRLLEDVCSFLTKEVQNGSLSAAAQSEAQKLVSRSKKQVDIIATLQDNARNTYPYLEMQKPSPLDEYVDADTLNHYEEEDVYEESYDQIETTRTESLSTQATAIEDYCPYNDLSPNQLSEKAIKFGTLYRKERYFILEQKKQLLVALVGYWLLIYSGKKDVKPLQVLNLSDYKAHAVEQKKDHMFEIVSENKKSFEFIARSDKDMEQWIVAINFKKQKPIGIPCRDLPDIPVSVSGSQTTDSFDSNDQDSLKRKKSYQFSLTSNSGSEGDIYENLEDLQIKNESPNDKTLKLPNLPPRHPLRHCHTSHEDKDSTYNNMPLSSSNEDIMEETEENTYDPVQTSTIEEEEEDIYDEPNVQNETANNYEDEECSYDIPNVEPSGFLQDSVKREKAPELTAISSDFEDEDVEYDEFKVCTGNVNADMQLNQKTVMQVNDTLAEQKKGAKPAVKSPKPKLILKVEKMTNFTFKQTEKSTQNLQNSQDNTPSKENNKTIRNLIQQMEASLVLKGTKH